MENMTLRQMRAKLDSKEISVWELTEQYLNRIHETNDTLNSFITLNTEHVKLRAEHAQKEINQGNQGPLTGIPYAAKDLFCTKGLRTTCGSKILSDYIPPYDATAIHKMGDAVLVGKTNMDEFAQGASNEYSAYGPVKNPYDLTRVSGGTSGGSAAAVASGQVPVALATDTGGSIRLPSSFCNVVGVKPTYGRVSRYGAAAMASSLDTIGPIAKTVEDAAMVLQAIAGVDAFDQTTPDVPVPNYRDSLTQSVQGMKIGLPKEYLELEGLDPGIKALFEQAVARLQSQGAEFVEVSLPHTKYAVPTYYVVVPSEVSSNMARYDGMQYGKPSDNAKSLEEVFYKTREEGFGPEVKRRIMMGTFALSAGYYDAYYKKAQQVRTLIIEDFSEVFQKVDVLFTPTFSTVPFKLGERDQDPLAMYLADVYTAPASLAGLSAISMPGGFLNDLPVGLQFIAPQFGEPVLFTAAAALERSSDIVAPDLKV
ncbi:MAG: Asp-tRNA(Asn)/Glu-tRNA(Gln) amidotransferase GatCAB subunit A [Candidatus Kerfeldbacteria bacterium CG15_BIG_FIL_POST_REV_8_21_14_020_45_12]|uniref:Glutamyl-tRNA(Gln) amidotransferase subunit A n=1 Tax=Candidatus Kerfeldbacteria bacterium CG15_BIG_FIL_POST_REV_8_21_14_020_45_12 TaxID=2014247 RepID=A0A2M7H2J8_9BACT|nr:MAG: Asp-tRNA(Asn)/Glu-tRNA(Gln) amidotransferase GatCAB subunit A [Candidatus Kerfeldbacteria bacterium CG15_BIG_FIL_POST_REV_8_21_14_020_45_12]PJA93488.1 MAG: Asp-tRNA(Asn)/Glu-tRNA(Gln) amidotransferase GatCAB subunit A [Candidatus Kerfeldbacteria bacterium CG_4_9_14_3_um_filter_45_8]